MSSKFYRGLVYGENLGYWCPRVSHILLLGINIVMAMGDLKQSWDFKLGK